jgi:predicted HTH domain antitoxin
MHLFQEGVVSIGKAASIAGEPRATFEILLAELGIPAVRYGLDEYQQDLAAFERARRK